MPSRLRALLHCCHIPVTVSSLEAALLAGAAGRPVSVPNVSIQLSDLTDENAVLAAEKRLQVGAGGTPCPFLKGAACSVYEHRPIACRTLVNLDDDELLCRAAAADAEPAWVPYADARSLKALALVAQAGATFADIRQFFPRSGLVRVAAD
ncbi:MAG: YkgJ family cysteine cluster protein [Burkholderiaceae bacterium]